MQTQPMQTAKLSPGTYSLTQTANDGRPDDYLQLVSDGRRVEVLVAGQLLREVADPDVVKWAAQVVPDFLLTGSLAPIPGGTAQS